MNLFNVLTTKEVTDAKGVIILPETVELSGDTVNDCITFSGNNKADTIHFEFPYEGENIQIDTFYDSFSLVNYNGNYVRFWING